MRTEELLKNVEIVKVIGTMPLNVESVVDDSRKSGKDSLFIYGSVCACDSAKTCRRNIF